MKLSEYMLLSREERTAHIDLSSECVLTGPARLRKTSIAAFLEVEDDVPNWIVGKIHRCHLCEHGRGKGNCTNPLHIYLGPPRENTLDIPEETRAKRVEAMAQANRDREYTKEDREAMSRGALKAREEGRCFTHHTDEAKEKCRQAAKRQHEEGLGAEWTDEQRAAQSERMTGVLKGRPQQQVQCPHCGIAGGLTNMRRYHFDNCKQKEIHP